MSLLNVRLIHSGRIGVLGEGYLGPLGAMYFPVCLMSKVSMNSIKDAAAWSGVTAVQEPISLNH